MAVTQGVVTPNMVRPMDRLPSGWRLPPGDRLGVVQHHTRHPVQTAMSVTDGIMTISETST
jgi:hypothetical protein